MTIGNVKAEMLRAGMIVRGAIFPEPVKVITTVAMGDLPHRAFDTVIDAASTPCATFRLILRA